MELDLNHDLHSLLPPFYREIAEYQQVCDAEKAQFSRTADSVLFGTDYPMWDPQHELARLRGMHLAPETERKILYDNAAALFGLEGEN